MLKCQCETQDDCTCSKGVVCLKHVTFYRGQRLILDDITFCIDQGIFLGVIGPNGGGKTTLLKLILGVLPLQQGRVEIFGHDLARSRDCRTMIGYVPQRSDVDQNFPATALDVVLMGAVAKTGLFRRISSETRQRAMDLLHMVGIVDLADRPSAVFPPGDDLWIGNSGIGIEGQDAPGQIYIKHRTCCDSEIVSTASAG